MRVTRRRLVSARKREDGRWRVDWIELGEDGVWRGRARLLCGAEVDLVLAADALGTLGSVADLLSPGDGPSFGPWWVPQGEGGGQPQAGDGRQV